MVSKRASVIALSTALSPIGDHFRRPPIVCPAAKISEMTEAMRSSNVVVIVTHHMAIAEPPRERRAVR